MKFKSIKASLLVLFLCAGLFNLQAAELNKPAPGFTLTDAAGKAHTLADYKGKYVVLEWVNYGCPFVKKHYNSGNMQQLQKTYTGKGVIWLTICSSVPGKQGYYSGEELLKLNKEKGAKSTANLMDETSEVGRMYDAKTTPHMYVINPAGILIYAGAIDDKRSTKLADVTGAKNYVASVLDDCMAGNKVEPFSTKPYGCNVKY